MADISNIKPGMKIIGANGAHLGTVAENEGHRIRLTAEDSPQTKDGQGAKTHYIPAGLVAEIEGDTVRLSSTATTAQEIFETTKG